MRIFLIVLMAIWLAIPNSLNAYNHSETPILPVENYQTSISTASKKASKKTKKVRVAAYNATRRQCKPDPSITAFGYSTKSPKCNILAISRDLEKAGLKPGTQVTIEGLDGIWIVADRMHYRWRNSIDILLPRRKDAINFGVQYLNISWLDRR